jgi:hypothetical protein
LTIAMSDSFVPFVTAPISTGESTMLHLKILGQADAKAVFEPLPIGGSPGPVAKDCGQPSVTLQRQGEVVSGIRIECGCGQVIELACAY